PRVRLQCFQGRDQTVGRENPEVLGRRPQRVDLGDHLGPGHLSRLETSWQPRQVEPTPGASVWGQGERCGGLIRGPRGESDAKARRLCYRLAAWSVPRGTSAG